MNPIDQLKYLKTLTITTGAVHDAQIHQLKNYHTILPNILSSKLTLDIENKTVEFDFSFKGGKMPSKKGKLALASDSIIKWTQYILWDNTTVVFKVNGVLWK